MNLVQKKVANSEHLQLDAAVSLNLKHETLYMFKEKETVCRVCSNLTLVKITSLFVLSERE